MLDPKETNKALSNFAREVIKQSRANLTRMKKRSSKKLYNSLGFDLAASKNSFSLALKMEDYGEFQDKGVSGTKVKHNTPFSYTNKRPPLSALDGWIVRKGLAPRTEGGQFKGRKSLQYLISKSIFEKGIRPSLFFTKPFEREFKKLPDEVVEAFALDLENFMAFTLKAEKK